MCIILLLIIAYTYPPLGRFAYTGTRDYTPFTTLPAALRFVEEELGGVQNMREYNRNLLVQASKHIIQRWGTFYVVSAQCFFIGCFPLFHTVGDDTF